MTQSGAPKSLEELYGAYYATEHEREWYEVSAVDKARNSLDFCSPLRPGRVLDIGAGSGAVTQRLVDAGLSEEIHAAEVSESALVELRTRLGGKLGGIHALHGHRLPCTDDQFDLAILSHVVEHVEHPRLLLYEARRVARHLYVEVPLEIVTLKTHLHRDFVLDTTGHINYYNRHTIRLLLQTSGWKVLRAEVRLPSAPPCRFLKGRGGKLKHAVKALAFRLFPNLSQHLFVFYACLLCARAPRLSTSLGEIT